MSRCVCQVDYHLRFTEARVLCGAGVGTGGVDRTFVRDGRGRMFVPGSHMKGLVRERCEQLYETLTGAELPSPHATSASPRTDVVARTFGQAGGHDLRCIFSDVTTSITRPTASLKRAQVRMNRFLGRPESQALFDTGFAVPAALDAYRGTVRLWTDGDSAVPAELALLCAGLRLVDGVGGTRSSGAGSVVVELDAVRVDGVAIELAAVLDALDGGVA